MFSVSNQSEAQVSMYLLQYIPYCIHSIVFYTDITNNACPIEKHSLWYKNKNNEKATRQNYFTLNAQHEFST